MGIQATNLDKWIEFLRSGNYPQGTGALQVAEFHEANDTDDDEYYEYFNEFCCLGVYDKSQGIDYEALGCTKEDLETVTTRARIGLSDQCCCVLAEINDHWKGFGLAEIADLLDTNRDSLIAYGDFPRDWYGDQAHNLPEKLLQHLG